MVSSLWPEVWPDEIFLELLIASHHCIKVAVLGKDSGGSYRRHKPGGANVALATTVARRAGSLTSIDAQTNGAKAAHARRHHERVYEASDCGWSVAVARND